MSMLNTNIPKKHSKSFDFYKWFYGSDISILDIKDKTYGDFIMAYNVKYPHMLLDINNIFKDKKLNVYKYPETLFQKSVYDLFDVKKSEFEEDNEDIAWYNLLPTLFIDTSYRSYNNGVIYYDTTDEIINYRMDYEGIYDEMMDDKGMDYEGMAVGGMGGGAESTGEFGNLFPASPLSVIDYKGNSTGIYFLSLPNQKDKTELEKLFNLMKQYGIKDIINFQSCAGILQAEQDNRQRKSWGLEFYSPRRPELWANCQYMYTRDDGLRADGTILKRDMFNNELDESVIDKVGLLLKDQNGDPMVELQDTIWTGGNPGFKDHVMLSEGLQSNAVIDYKTVYDIDGSRIVQEIPLGYENWNIHWSDGSAGNEEMWSLLTSCIIRTLCLEKRRIAIHCWGGFGRTGNAVALAFMLKIIYFNPSQHGKFLKLCENWLNKIRYYEVDKARRYVNKIFEVYGIFQEGVLKTETDTGTELDIELVKKINDGTQCGSNCRADHKRALTARVREILNSKFVIHRMTNIMRQLKFVIEILSSDAENLQGNWNPYIQKLYDFLKDKGVITQPQGLAQLRAQIDAQMAATSAQMAATSAQQTQQEPGAVEEASEGSPSDTPPGQRGSPSDTPPNRTPDEQGSDSIYETARVGPRSSDEPGSGSIYETAMEYPL